MEKGFVGITSHQWWTYIKTKNINTLNFWCKKKSFKALNQGEPFFFLKKNGPNEFGERKIVGYATFISFEYLSIDEAWEKYTQGNGFDTIEEFKRNLPAIVNDSIAYVGCIILENYVELEHPIYLSEIGISFPNAIVSGKTINEDECNLILDIDRKAQKCNVKNEIRLTTEHYLRELLEENSKYLININNKINTTVTCVNKTILTIYYRQDEIRINIKNDSILKNKYSLLETKKIVYQKETANPNSTKGEYSFFVKKNNIKTALVNLLLSINDYVVAEESNDGKIVCSRCNYKFKKAKRCPNCGQLMKYGE